MDANKVEIYIEHGEEVPTDVKKMVKVLELPVFGYDEKKRLDNALDGIEKLAKLAESASLPDSFFAQVSEMHDALGALTATLRDNEERIISFLGRSLENAEVMSKSLTGVDVSISALNDRLNEMERKFDEKTYGIDSSLDYSKGVVIEAADRIRLAADETDRKMSMIIENMSEKFDAHIASVNNRIDAMAVQTLDSINETSVRVDALRKSVDSLKARRAIVKVSLPTTAFEMLAGAKKKIRGKRVPKARQADKKRLLESVDALEQRLIDIFIFSALGTKRLSASAIKKEVPITPSKVSKRMAQLTTGGKLARAKKGRYFVFYVA